MKKHLTTLLLASLGILSPIGFSFAFDDANLLQPAEQTTNFESIRVGVAGQGGVTFFNGSVLNEEGPYVIADDLRVDGSIWRGPSKGTSDGQPLKIADTLMPALTNANDMGNNTMRWKDIYYQGDLHGGNANIDELTVGGGSGNSGVTINNNGNVQIDGDVTQERNSEGLIKANAHMHGSAEGCSINKQYNSQGTQIGCTRESQGNYLIDFNFDISDRYIQVTPSREISGFWFENFYVAMLEYRESYNDNQVRVRLYSVEYDNQVDLDFYISVF